MTGLVSTLVIAVLIAACGGPQTSGGSPSPSAGPSGGGTDACARAAASGGWTTERSYVRGIVPRGDSIQLGLGGRSRVSARAIVKAPDGSELSSTKTQEQSRGDVVHYVVRYPADFTPAGVTGVLGITTPGTYQSPPRRVAAQFRTGQVAYRVDASAEGTPDLADRVREVVICAQQRLR